MQLHRDIDERDLNLPFWLLRVCILTEPVHWHLKVAPEMQAEKRRWKNKKASKEAFY